MKKQIEKQWFHVVVKTEEGQRIAFGISAEDEADAEDRAEVRYPGCLVESVS